MAYATLGFWKSMPRWAPLAAMFLRLTLAVQSSVCLSSAANFPKSPEKPVGVIESAEGAVFVDTHQSETSWTAVPGILLFPGYTLHNIKGSVRFSFCPNESDFSLVPGGAVTFRE